MIHQEGKRYGKVVTFICFRLQMVLLYFDRFRKLVLVQAGTVVYFTKWGSIVLAAGYFLLLLTLFRLSNAVFGIYTPLRFINLSKEFRFYMLLETYGSLKIASRDGLTKNIEKFINLLKLTISSKENEANYLQFENAVEGIIVTYSVFWLMFFKAMTIESVMCDTFYQANNFYQSRWFVEHSLTYYKNQQQNKTAKIYFSQFFK